MNESWSVLKDGALRRENEGSAGFAQCIDPLSDPNWDSILATIPSASFFHGASWAHVLRETYAFSPCYFVVAALSGINSLLPVMEVNSWITGRRGVSLPFADECEPLCLSSGSFYQVFEAARVFAKTQSWRYLEFRGGRTWLHEARSSDSFLGHCLDLRDKEHNLLDQMRKSTQGAIRRAEDYGLMVEFSHGSEALEAFYGLLCKTRRRQGLPPQPYRFFANIHRYVFSANKGCVVLARLNGVPIAGAVFFQSGNTVLYKYAASDTRYRNLCANNLVVWNAIKWHQQRGFEVFDFGRTSKENEGLRKFKLGWGSKEYELDYFRYEPRSGGFVETNSKSRGRGRSIFKLLPAPLSRLAGSALYRHVA